MFARYPMTRQEYIDLKTAWSQPLLKSGWIEQASTVVDCLWSHVSFPGRAIGVRLVPESWDDPIRWSYYKGVFVMAQGAATASLQLHLDWLHSSRSVFAVENGAA